MDQTASIHGLGTKREAKEQHKQLAQYVEQQPESMQAFHTWMTCLEAASLVVVAAVFILALYLSINWTSVPAKVIPTAWFAFPGNFSLTVLLLGLHTVILKAFSPVVGLHTVALRASFPVALPGKNQQFVTGSEAVGRGWTFILIGLLAGAFWGFIAYATWTLNWTMLEPLIGILGVVMGVGIAISILYSMFQKVFKTR